MWVKIVPECLAEADLLLPEPLASPVSPLPERLRFGAGELAVRVRPRPAGPGPGAPGWDPRPAGPAPGAPPPGPRDPLELRVSPHLVSALHIRTEPLYRLRVTGTLLELGPVAGLLLGNRNHWYDNGYLMREAERVTGVYPLTGGLFCAFSPRNIDPHRGCAYGLYYAPDRREWRFGTLPLPMALHRRSFHNDQSAIDRLRRLTGATIFNSRRYDKWELSEILSTDPQMRRYLPETRRVTDGREVFELLERWPSVILKPSNLSRGRGILIVLSEPDGYRLIDCRAAGRESVTCLDRNRLQALLESEIAHRRYLCQQRIDLATVGGAAFDIRVVMQRRPDGAWNCQGIECRVAATGLHVTNIAFGGRALRLAEAIPAAFGDRVSAAEAEGTVISISDRVCRLMDRTGQRFSEFGIDIAYDRSGAPWFIEANVLPTFKGFMAIDPAAYRNILAAPLLYAASLTGFGPDPDR